MNPFIVGPPITSPENFFGRRAQVDRVFEMLRGPALHPLCVRGFRRSGKTSFLNHLANREVIQRELADAPRPTIVAYVDLLLDVRTPHRFFVEVAEAIARAVQGHHKVKVPAAFASTRQFRQWLENVLRTVPDSRIVILLDEFEVLEEEPAFDQAFFNFLRALAGFTLDARLTWITASLRDLYGISRKMGDDGKSSPFFNIFHPTPVIIGGLEADEARELVRELAARGDVALAPEEVEAIRSTSGDLPYFLQAAGEKWFLGKLSEPSLSLAERYTKTISQLLDEPNSVPQQIRHYWEALSKSEQASMRAALQGRLQSFRYQVVDNLAVELGLLSERNGFYWICGEIFIRWILARAPADGQAALPAAGALPVRPDVVIVTALPEELEAVLNKMPGFRQLPPSAEDIRVYYQASLDGAPNGDSAVPCNVVALCLLGMGRVQAAIATADAIRRWQPPYLILVGIAGGIAKNGVQVGDVLIAEQIVDYELQKLLPSGPQIRYEIYRANARLLSASRGFHGARAARLIDSLIGVTRPAEGQPQHHFGPIASGDKVVAVSDILAGYLSDFPRLIGVEMEAAGVAAASFQSGTSTEFFMVRGVSDLADESKDTADTRRWRAYACDVAASYAIAFLRSGSLLYRSQSGAEERSWPSAG